MSAAKGGGDSAVPRVRQALEAAVVIVLVALTWAALELSALEVLILPSLVLVGVLSASGPLVVGGTLGGLCGGLLGACAAWWRASFVAGALPGAAAGYLIETWTGFVADQTLGHFGPAFAALSLASLTGAALEKPAVVPHRPRPRAIVAGALAGAMVGALALRAWGPEPGPAALRAMLVVGHLVLAAGVRLTLPSAAR